MGLLITHRGEWNTEGRVLENLKQCSSYRITYSKPIPGHTGTRWQKPTCPTRNCKVRNRNVVGSRCCTAVPPIEVLFRRFIVATRPFKFTWCHGIGCRSLDQHRKNGTQKGGCMLGDPSEFGKGGNTNGRAGRRGDSRRINLSRLLLKAYKTLSLLS